MRPVSNYAPVWEARASRHVEGTAGKRRRSLDERESDDEQNSITFDDTVEDFRRSVKTLEGKRDPFYVAGVPPGESLPPAPFPHSVKEDDRRTRSKKSRSVIPDETSHSLQQRHLAVMTNILHVSLAKGDFLRAGRAWGMLLRSVNEGRPIDPRLNGRWGIGAEILLRRDASTTLGDGTRAKEISKDGFQAAKDYYEQLILQYPHHRHLPNVVDARSFYPAMFGLLIFETVDMSKRAIHRVHESSPELSSPAYSDRSSDALRKGEIADIKRAELDSATQIAARLDALLLMPPYDKYNPLIRIRGMIGLWIADLYDDISASVAQSDEDEAEDLASPKQRLQPYVARQEIERNSEMAVIEREKAHTAFKKVVDGGDTLPDVLRSYAR